MPSHIKKGRSIKKKSKKSKRVYTSPVDRAVKKSPLKRIAYRTGTVGSISRGAIIDIQSKARVFVDNVVKTAMTVTEHARAKTVSHKAVLYALENLNYTGIKLRGSSPTKKCGIYSRGKRSGSRISKVSREILRSRKIKFYQKNSHDCVTLPKKGVESLVRSIAENYHGSIRFSAKALAAIQDALEQYLFILLKRSGIIANHRSCGSRSKCTAGKVSPIDVGIVDAILEGFGM